jgi:Ca2+/Na+ antiporter
VGFLSHWPLLLFLLLVGSPLYFLPSFVAIARKHQVGKVIALNTLLGWTVVGWVVSLAIAFGALGTAAPPVVVRAASLLSPDGRYYWDGRAWQPVGPQV